MPPLLIRLAIVLWMNLAFVAASMSVAAASFATYLVLQSFGAALSPTLAVVATALVLIACAAGSYWAATLVPGWTGCQSLSPAVLVLGFFGGFWLGGWAEGFVLPFVKSTLFTDASLAGLEGSDVGDGLLALAGGSLGVLLATFLPVRRRPPITAGLGEK